MEIVLARTLANSQTDSKLKKKGGKKWMLYKRANAISVSLSKIYLLPALTGIIVWQIHKCIANFLVARGDWGETLNGNQRCDMWLAGWCSKVTVKERKLLPFPTLEILEICH